jgi:FMN phosphatase YigB (HAD superfamily)
VTVPGRIRAVVFDVGETLVDETREWEAWADALGIPRLTLLGTLGGLAAAGEHHRRVFELAAPGADLDAAAARLDFAGYEARDLYPDALPCLHELAAARYAVGIAGNQPEATEAFLRELGVELALVGSSARWGVAKPDPAFFARLAAELDLPPSAIAHVGDRVDNDVVPAAEAGMAAVHVRRGPWGVLQARWPQAERAALRVDGLAGLARALARV